MTFILWLLFICTGANAKIGEGRAAVIERQLDAKQRQIIRQHSIQDLADELLKGKGLTFEIMPFEDGVKIPFTYKSGEEIQAIFVQAILEELFPRSRFEALDYRRDAKKSIRKPLGPRVRLSVMDGAESPIWRSTGDIEGVQMPLLKVANGHYREFSKSETRTELGFSPQAKIAHVYANYSNTTYDRNWRPSFFDFFAKLRGLGYSVIVLSWMGSEHEHERQWTLERQREIMELFDSVVNLTDLSSNAERLGATMVFNDTRGKMLKIHTASDLVVVTGPINYFEALYSGTATVHFDNAMLSGDYEKAAIKTMANIAAEFPNYTRVTRLSDITVPKVSQKKDFYPREALTTLLDNLEASIRRSLNMRSCAKDLSSL